MSREKGRPATPVVAGPTEKYVHRAVPSWPFTARYAPVRATGTRKPAPTATTVVNTDSNRRPFGTARASSNTVSSQKPPTIGSRVSLRIRTRPPKRPEAASHRTRTRCA